LEENLDEQYKVIEEKDSKIKELQDLQLETVQSTENSALFNVDMLDCDEFIKMSKYN